MSDYGDICRDIMAADRASRLPEMGEGELIYQIRNCARSHDWKTTPGTDPNAWTRWMEVSKEVYETCGTQPKYEGRVLRVEALVRGKT